MIKCPDDNTAIVTFGDGDVPKGREFSMVYTLAGMAGLIMREFGLDALSINTDGREALDEVVIKFEDSSGTFHITTKLKKGEEVKAATTQKRKLML